MFSFDERSLGMGIPYGRDVLKDGGKMEGTRKERRDERWEKLSNQNERVSM
jgi:hypothetical protein